MRAYLRRLLVSALGLELRDIPGMLSDAQIQSVSASKLTGHVVSHQIAAGALLQHHSCQTKTTDR